MKALWLSLCLLALLVAGLFVNAYFVHRAIDETQAEVDALPVPSPGEDPAKTDLSAQLEAVRRLREAWDRRLHLVSLSVNHNDIMAVQQQFAALRGAAEAGDYSGYTVARRCLADALDHLSQLAGVGIDVLF